MVSIDVDYGEVRRLNSDLRNASGGVAAKASAAIRKTAFDIERDAKVLVAKDTGNLAGSISTDIEPMSAEIGPTAEYGAHVEYGTSPHVIRPTNPGGKLVFAVGGQLVFADKVNHPGTSPQPYMGPAFDRRAPGLEAALGQIGEDVL